MAGLLMSCAGAEDLILNTIDSAVIHSAILSQIKKEFFNLE